MRSVSVQISWVSARSSSLTPGSSSWAAPRMPDSGFLISCASTCAMPDTERAAARWVSWRSIICAIERCCSISMIRPGLSGSAPPNTSTTRLTPLRGRPTSTPYSLTVAPVRRTWADQGRQRAREGDDVGQRLPLQHALAEREERFGGGVGVERRGRRRPAPGWDAAGRRAADRTRCAGAERWDPARSRAASAALMRPSPRGISAAWA